MKMKNSVGVGCVRKVGFALGVLAVSGMLFGCATSSTPVWLPPGVQAAACAVVIAQPSAETYLRLAGEAFQDLGRQDALPSTKELESRLTTIPMGGMTEEQARMVWGSVLAVWDGLLATAKDQATVTRLRDTLTSVGRAIEAGAVTCAPPKLATVTVLPSATEVEPVKVEKVAVEAATALKK